MAKKEYFHVKKANFFGILGPSIICSIQGVTMAALFYTRLLYKIEMIDEGIYTQSKDFVQ